MRSINFILLSLTALLAFSCGRRQPAGDQFAYTLKNDTVYLHSAEVFAGRIKTCGPEQESVAKEVVTAGTVQPVPNRIAYIAPPFSGRIVKSYISMGQRVSANTPLFEIMSPDFTAMQKDYFQAESEREMARKDLQRKKELIANRLCSDKEYEEAENALKQADKEFENARAALLVHNVNTENMVLGQPLVVRSPISGEVINNNIVVGLYLNDDADPVAVVADISRVWVAAQVKEKDIRYIREGDKMQIHVDALPGKVLEGMVFHVEESVDEDTRSIRVLSAFDNAGVGLKLGMYATVHFFGEPETYTVVPEKAIMQAENHSYVLSAPDPAYLLRKPVEVAFTDAGRAYVSQGIDAAESIISEGGYYFQ